ncbi:MAG: sigma-70 family RNA polymerase sigma factor [bacterium]|nr:MAG: sigma-70 family RNA polymerase sigma factor [bacterium]
MRSFEEIYEGFGPQIIRYLARLVSESEAEDLAQETFLRVHRGLEEFRGDSRISTWIYRIATNVARDRLRKASSMSGGAVTSLEEGMDVEDGNVWTDEKARNTEGMTIRKEMNDCIRRFIDDLPEDYRTVLILQDLEGFKNQEIADILGISLDNVKIRLHRARTRLREELQTGCSFHRDEEDELGCDLKQPQD